jgi:thioredoxin reductase
MMFDVVIAGGGIAGLSAALILARCCRKVLVCDAGKPRNRVSKALHGYLSRDGISPWHLRDMGRQELARYPSVSFLEGEVTDAAPISEGYRVTLKDGRSFQGKYLVVATGVVDKLPEIEGVNELYGSHLFHCPYCDGWEMRDRPLAVYGSGTTGYEYALELIGWSRDVVLCTDGGESPSNEQVRQLERNRVGIRTQPIRRLAKGSDEMMVIWFADGSGIARRALFFNPLQYQASPLAEKLGCSVTEGGVVKTGKFQQTSSRLFVIGDAARSIQLAIIAAAEGAEAAYAINTALQKESIM